MVGFRKRTYGSSFKPTGSRNFKRRRTTGKFKRRGRKVVSQTTQSAVAGGMQFKAKKLSRSRWKKMLWDSTLQKSHYRSASGNSGTMSTPVANNVFALTFLQAMDNGTAPFWTAAGGAVTTDTGTAVPFFQDELIVRGGRCGITVYNDSNGVGLSNAPVEIWLFLVRNAPRAAAGLAALPATVPVGWDPTIQPEFRRDVGTIIMKRRFLLEANATGELEFRLPIFKLDQEAWITDQQRFVWLVLGKDFDPVDQNTVRLITYHNLSFCGDSLGGA